MESHFKSSWFNTIASDCIKLKSCIVYVKYNFAGQNDNPPEVYNSVGQGRAVCDDYYSQS